jgi:hypothetical protein
MPALHINMRQIQLRNLPGMLDTPVHVVRIHSLGRQVSPNQIFDLRRCAIQIAATARESVTSYTEFPYDIGTTILVTDDDDDLHFCRDKPKALSNRKKHGVSFESATYVFDDPPRLERSIEAS